MILTFDGTLAIRTDATINQSKQANSKHTNGKFIILTFVGSLAIKTGVTTRQRMQATSKDINEGYTRKTICEDRGRGGGKGTRRRRRQNPSRELE